MSAIDNVFWKEGLPVGWHPLFDQLVADLMREDADATIRDAKQKFGSLRVYLKRLSPVIEALIDDASRLSARTCETCGQPGVLVVSEDGWYATLCDQHRGESKPPAQNPVLASFRVYQNGKVRLIDRL